MHVHMFMHIKIHMHMRMHACARKSMSVYMYLQFHTYAFFCIQVMQRPIRKQIDVYADAFVHDHACVPVHLCVGDCKCLYGCVSVRDVLGNFN